MELAVRAALGAARLRLVRQLLIESLLIGTLAAVTGLLLAQWLVPALLALNAVAVPRTAGIVLDARVLLFTVALAIVTPLLFGLIPSLQASRADLPEVLAQGGRGSSAPTRARVRAMLVATEVAIAVILLVGSSLLLHSFANVMSVERGFETSGAITATMAIPGTKYPDAPRAAMFYKGLLERIRQIPDVAAAGAVNQMPLAGGDFGGGLRFEDSGGTTSGYTASAGYRVATPGYLEALGVRVVQGRTLDDSDRPGRPPSAVVNEAFVRQYLAARNPIGVRFNYAGMDPVNPVFTIVGVVGDVHHRSLVRAAAPEVFVCAYQQPFRTRWKMTAVIRTANSAQQNTLAVAVRQAVRDFDPDVPVEVSTLEHVVDASVADRRFMLMVFGTFAAIALVLAATGIYGVLSQSVAQRTQEIGIRMALGADARSVLQLAIGSAMKAVLIGLAVGASGAVATVRLIQSFLFNVKPADPISFAGATLLLLTVGFVAAYLPARRATRVDPLLALRAQ